jgi:hypothetical protein
MKQADCAGEHGQSETRVPYEDKVVIVVGAGPCRRQLKLIPLHKDRGVRVAMDKDAHRDINIANRGLLQRDSVY